jgi:hypothetical protein
MHREIHMRKIVLFAVVALIVIATGAWVAVRTLTPAIAIAGSTYNPPAMTGAKGLPTSHDDYDIVVY